MKRRIEMAILIMAVLIPVFILSTLALTSDSADESAFGPSDDFSDDFAGTDIDVDKAVVIDEANDEVNDAINDEVNDVIDDEVNDVINIELNDQINDAVINEVNNEVNYEENDAESQSNFMRFTGLFSDNPAGGAFSEIRFELVSTDLSMVFKNNLFNLNNLNADLQDLEAKSEFLSRLGVGGFKADLDGHLKAGIKIGRLGLHLRPVLIGSIDTGAAVPDLIFNGIDINETYDLSGVRADGLAALSFDVSYAYPIQLKNSSIGVGMTMHYLKGLALLHAKIGEGTISTDELGNMSYHIEDLSTVYGLDEFFREVSADISDYATAKGTGIIFDFGAIYRQGPFQAGVTLKNIGRISWNGIHGERYGEKEGDIVTGGPNGPELPDLEDFKLESESFGSYTHSIPAVIEFAGAYQILPSIVWRLGVSTGLDNGWGVSTIPRLSTGIDWSPLPLLVVGGDLALQGGYIDIGSLLEFRFNPLCFGFRFGWSDNRINRFSDDSTGFSSSLTMGLRF